jgi:hypothetical protein
MERPTKEHTGYVRPSKAAPEGEAAALTAVYRFLLERHANRTAIGSRSGPKQEGGADGTLTPEQGKKAVST